jgi:response regulator RpfG family c-di-GMP phosphodiesterase
VRLLLVDDDPGLRALLRTTLDVFDVELEEAEDTTQAAESIARRRPDAVVLDIALPGVDGLAYCATLKEDAATRDIPVVLLTGADATEGAGRAAGADAYLRKPFRPLELLSIVERLAGWRYGVPYSPVLRRGDEEEQLLLYARDLRHLLELERGQRLLVQDAYRETVAALASALESKDTGTRAHSQRVQRYATELTRAVAPDLLNDESTEYGYLLHDVGKIGIPDDVLLKPRPLTPAEERLMQTHTQLGEQMLGSVGFLHGEGLRVVRSHHERWDGEGYPDALTRDAIPLGARIFAVADTLDVITSTRPYRPARSWTEARNEIVSGRGKQFDPDVVDAFRQCEGGLAEIRRDVAQG